MITLSKHAEQKIKERFIELDSIIATIKQPDFLFYDIEADTMVAIKETEIAGIKIHLVVPFAVKNDTIKIVTVYPCRNIAKEINSKEGKKWIKIK